MPFVVDVLQDLAGFITFRTLEIVKASSIQQCFFQISFLLVVFAQEQQALTQLFVNYELLVSALQVQLESLDSFRFEIRSHQVV